MVHATEVLGSHGHQNVEAVVARLLEPYDSRYGIGHMSCSVYDTAWVANVTKTVNGVPQYLFPSSFFAILEAQLADGSWSGHFDRRNRVHGSSLSAPKEASSSLCDSILSTMASLYTLILHSKQPHQIPASRIPLPSLTTRISRAVESLELMLACWRIDSCNAVGFEVLAPALLDLLSAEGYLFAFPDRDRLLKIRDAKLSRLSAKHLYLSAPSAILHSLEAFHGVEAIDVRRLKHHLVGGSMMASPAATASYLMRSLDWDDSAEAYLRLVVECGEGNGSGCVPSAWPSTTFEMLWVVSTFVEFHVWDLQNGNRWNDSILNIVAQSRLGARGLVGFAPGIEPDLDDSAKASIILSHSGRTGFSQAIVNEFDGSRCLRTYRGERDPSVSANCNGLMSLLVDESEFPGKTEVMEKIITFLYDAYAEAQGNISDKWNLSAHYPLMLISRALTEFLSRWTLGRLAPSFDRLVASKVVPLLVRCILKTLRTQLPNGSWGTLGPFEETAYAVLTLASFLSLPLSCPIRTNVETALQRGRRLLAMNGDSRDEYLWIEKITYRSEFLKDTYVHAALYCNPEKLWHGARAPVTELASLVEQELQAESLPATTAWGAKSRDDIIHMHVSGCGADIEQHHSSLPNAVQG